MKKIVTIVGARPQFVKAAVMSRLLRSGQYAKHFSEVLVHTGQHHDDALSAVFFRELQLPPPDIQLHVDEALHGRMTAIMLMGIEEILIEQQPDLVMVYGDTNSTLAGALAAAKLHIPIAHVEAGLRSYNKTMPEEHNRLITDNLSRWLFCPSSNAVENLRKENITSGVHLCGDIMYDALLFYKDLLQHPQHGLRLKLSGMPEGLYEQPFFLATIHRAGNTDDPQKLSAIVGALAESHHPIVLPLHPRTRKMLQQFNIQLSHNIHIVPPVGYLEMLQLELNAAAIITDSGGVQKEAYWMKKPCITLREETEWTETVDSGWNTLAGTDGNKIRNALNKLQIPDLHPNHYGNGQSGVKMMQVLMEDLLR